MRTFQEWAAQMPPELTMRAMSTARVGGIVIPDRVPDKYGTWWDRRSDLVLDLIERKPLLIWHLMTGELMRAGTWDESVFRWIDGHGLYGEADLLQNRASESLLEMLRANDAAWSTGALPGGIAVDKKSGYVSRWPVVEASAASARGVVSQPNTTKAIHVRAALEPSVLAILSDEDLIRSEWNMPPELNGTNGAAPAAAAPAAETTLTMTTAQLDARIEAALNAAAPTRALPGSSGRPGFFENVSVSSPYDAVSALGLCLLDQARQANAVQRAQVHQRPEEFMRALAVKVERLFQDEMNANPAFVEDGDQSIRAIDPIAAGAWGKYMGSSMRANELMGSTVSGAGDELVPTLLSPVAWYSFKMESRLFGWLKSFMLPSVPYAYPTISGGPTFRKATEPTGQSQANITASYINFGTKPTTALKTFSPGMMGAGILFSELLFTDAGLNVAEIAATQLARNGASAIDAWLFNGDEDTGTTNISNHGAVISGTAYDAWGTIDGLRDMAFADSCTVDVAGAIDIDDLTLIQVKLGARGIKGTDLENLAFFCDPGVYYALKKLSAFRTFDTAGPEMYTLKHGFVGMWDNVPVVVSDELEYTDATQVGKMVNAHNGTEGSGHLIHRGSIMVGVARNLEMEVSKVPHSGMYAASMSARLDVQEMEAASVASLIGVNL